MLTPVKLTSETITTASGAKVIKTTGLATMTDRTVKANSKARDYLKKLSASFSEDERHNFYRDVEMHCDVVAGIMEEQYAEKHGLELPDKCIVCRKPR